MNIQAQPSSLPSLPLGRPRRRWTRRRLRDNVAAYLFIAPNIIAFLAFLAVPLVRSIILCFQNWQPFGSSPWVGLDNFRQLFADWTFGLAYQHAVLYAIYTIPAGLVWGIVTAVALSRLQRTRVLFRTLFYLPSLTSGVAVALMWSWIFNGNDYGLLNAFLHLFGIAGANWLGDPSWALPAISLTVVWNGTGYWMLIFLAGLMDIPPMYYEAARVDGASEWHSFWRITLPLLTPTIFFYLVLAFLSVWTQFDTVYVMTQGGPANATLMPAYLLYTDAFQNLQISYSSAMAWVIGIIAFVLAGLNFLLGRRWVQYAR
jgi:multiple sugar transport system permease protein